MSKSSSIWFCVALVWPDIRLSGDLASPEILRDITNMIIMRLSD